MICTCPKDKRQWKVLDRNCNYSAFNGYHWTSSDYSRVWCLKCGCSWRTKANYVASLPDGTRDEYRNAPLVNPHA